MFIVVGAVCFNLGLCFLNTSFISVSNVHVIACEALFISAALLVAYRSTQQPHVLLLGVIALYTLTLTSLRVVFGLDQSIDVKIVRDFVIPVAFFLLGLRARSAKDADYVVAYAAGIVLVVALFEYFWIDAFTKVFNVAKYYISRGTMEARDALQSADLFVSGIRPAGPQGGRNLLPFLGDHRVSSVFLEPVSTGNFGVIVFMWGLVRTKFDDQRHIGLMVVGLTIIVLADSRFGAYLCGMAIIVAMLPTRLAFFGLMPLPLIALIILTMVVPVLVTGSFDPQRRYLDNGVLGRLVLSGRMLAEFDVLNWIGLRPTREQTFDSGYAYVVSGIGILGVVAIWYFLMGLRGPDRQFHVFRNLAAVYYAVLLCVSNSPFTIKTASLLWFLVGALWYRTGQQGKAMPAPASQTSPSLMRRPLAPSGRLPVRRDDHDWRLSPRRERGA